MRVLAKSILSSILFFTSYVSLFGQQYTISGIVKDKSNGDLMVGALMFVKEQAAAETSCDANGKYLITLPKGNYHIICSSVGYQTETIEVNLTSDFNLDINLKPNEESLQTVEVRVEKYRNKDNPAVALMKKVIENKEKNHNTSYDYYSFNKYEKLEFSLNNVTDKMKNNLLFRNIKFIFDQADTNQQTGQVYLPMFLKESISDVYYRKEPQSKKEYVHGDRITNFGSLFNSMGVSQVTNNMYQEVDFYENTIMLLTNGFVSPLAPIAPSVYRFYIQDTTVINNTSLIHLYFAPRTKTDFAFMGHLWVANDSTYALHKIEAGIANDINLNWVKSLEISQEYDWVSLQNVPGRNTAPKRGLMLTKNNLVIDFALNKGNETKSIIGKKTTSYKDIEINKPLHDSLFAMPGAVLMEPNVAKNDEAFWDQYRHMPLSSSESGIYQMVDSLNNYKPFKRAMSIGKLFIVGYTSVGGFDIGPANTFYSFNPIEGFRVRLGGRTNLKFSDKVMFEGYGAYGFKDKKFKSYAALRFNFGDSDMMKFPFNQLKIYHQNEIKIPGQELQFVQEDNIFLSIKRGLNNKMLYIQSLGIEYKREHEYGFSYTLSAKKMKQSPAGVLKFEFDSLENRMVKAQVQTTELGVKLRYAPHEKFYEGANYRTPMLNKYPIFELQYTAGIKSPNAGEYNYHNIQAKIKKVFYMPPFGYSELIVEGGRLFGQVPYTLLTTHRANQTYSYQLESYNLMNFMEFVSDKYASINYHHNFQGVFFGRIPVLKSLKWREVITFKSLWGGLDEKNIPSADNHLLRFPTDENGQLLTYHLGSKPYIETSVGIGNIFRVLRLDYVRRLNYNENPNVSKWGIRARVRFEF